jgi:hypothetical protein
MLLSVFKGTEATALAKATLSLYRLAQTIQLLADDCRTKGVDINVDELLSAWRKLTEAEFKALLWVNSILTISKVFVSLPMLLFHHFLLWCYNIISLLSLYYFPAIASLSSRYRFNIFR